MSEMTPEQIAAHEIRQEALDAWDFAVLQFNEREQYREWESVGLIAASLIQLSHENAPFGPSMGTPAAVAQGR